MKEAYPETFLRGLSGKTAVTDDGYVLSEAFQFSENKERTKDGMHEMSVNWEDGNEAVDQLLGQKKKDSDAVQFNIGFCRFASAKLKEWFGTHIQNGDFGYERHPVDGNPHHGNLLASPTIKPSVKKNITHTLANMATIDLYKRDSGVSPYLQKDNNKKMAEDKIEKKMPPKVSVIVPVYGVEKYIERCARSLFEQTLDDIEYLFINDCTPDRSIEILESVLEEYPNRKEQVVIHRMEQNSGQAKVREWGMKNMTGEYVIHCDSDDWVDSDMYRAMYDKAKEENADVVVCDYKISNGTDILKHVKGCGSTDCEQFLMRQLFQRDPWSLCNKLFKKQLVTKDLIYPNGNMGEDMVICLQLMFRCHRMGYVEGQYYYYYSNEASISNLRDASLHIRNYERLKMNTDLLIEILKDKNIKHKKWIINGFQYNATITLLNVIHSDKRYRDLWMDTYPGANLRYVFNPYMKLERRFKCLLALVGLYPFKKDRI